MQLKSRIDINDDTALEREADIMGEKAMHSNPAQLSKMKGNDFSGNQSETNMPIQRRLVHMNGAPLSTAEIEGLKKQYPKYESQIDQNHSSQQDYTLRGTRNELHFTEYPPPSSSSWKWSMPQGFHASHGGDSVYTAAKSEGLGMGLGRTSMSTDFTGDILKHQGLTGVKFQGASPLEQGKGLKESGLARTHHVADSSVRAIIEYLHKNHQWTQYPGGLNKVLNWMKSMTHGLGTADGMLQRLLNPKGVPDLEAVVNGLSNNTWNVGIGDADKNSKIGPMRDSSVTKSGFPTPQSFATDIGLEYLRGIVPDGIIEAARAQLVDDKTGKAQHSMDVDMTYTSLPSPGIHNARDLSPAQIIAIVEQGYRQKSQWAVSIINHLKGNHEAIIQSALTHDMQFAVSPLGLVAIRLRGG